MKIIKNILAFIILSFSLIAILYIIYLKTYYVNDDIMSEHKINESSNVAINNALNEIIDKFNNSEEILKLNEGKKIVTSKVNNFSLFVTYSDIDSITYEFTYRDLILSINNYSDDEKFNMILINLVKSIQLRLNNEVSDEDVNLCIKDNSCLGVILEDDTYKLNIVEKIRKSN